jgi:hypothetical protein
MLLAELEVWHSRPFTPTRRVALGHLALPVEPPPGFGGLLLAGVVAGHLPGVDADVVADLHRLVGEVEHGRRVVQPRLRHRYQADRHGLARSSQRLVGTGDEVTFELECNGSPLQQVLGAVYAAERLAEHHRHAVCGALHKALRWNGELGPSFISFVTGATSLRAERFHAMADPVAWALGILGLPAQEVQPDKREVMTAFRTRLRAVHPDHGGDEVVASREIGDLAEARRILLEKAR